MRCFDTTRLESSQWTRNVTCADDGDWLEDRSTTKDDYKLLLNMRQYLMLMKNIMQWVQNNYFVLYQMNHSTQYVWWLPLWNHQAPQTIKNQFLHVGKSWKNIRVDSSMSTKIENNYTFSFIHVYKKWRSYYLTIHNITSYNNNNNQDLNHSCNTGKYHLIVMIKSSI